MIKARQYKCDRYRCGICDRKPPKYNKSKGTRRWRALDIGNSIPVYVESEAPRVERPEHGAVVSQISWTRHGSGFTKNMEDYVVWFSLYMSQKAISEFLSVKWKTVGSIIGHTVKELSEGTDRFANLVNIGIDEPLYKKEHKYFTVVVNHDTNTVVWVGIRFGKLISKGFFELLNEEQKAGIKAVSGDGAG